MMLLLRIIFVGCDSIAFYHLSIKMLFVLLVLSVHWVFLVDVVFELLAKPLLVLFIVLVISLFLESFHLNLLKHLLTLTCQLLSFYSCLIFFVLHSNLQVLAIILCLLFLEHFVLTLLSFPSFSLSLNNCTPFVNVSSFVNWVVAHLVVMKTLDLFLFLF